MSGALKCMNSSKNVSMLVMLVTSVYSQTFGVPTNLVKKILLVRVQNDFFFNFDALLVFQIQRHEVVLALLFRLKIYIP